MCEPLTIGMAVVGLVSGIAGADQQGKAWAASETARRKNLIEAVRQSNYADASLQLQGADNFKEAQAELNANSMSAIQANSTVRTAAGESGMEGRTVDRIVRDTENVYLRTKGQITDNYERDYHNIWVQREANRNELISVFNSSAASPKPTALGQTLDIAGSTVQGALVGQQLSGLWGNAPPAGKQVNVEQTTNRGGKKRV